MELPARTRHNSYRSGSRSQRQSVPRTIAHQPKVLRMPLLLQRVKRLFGFHNGKHAALITRMDEVLVLIDQFNEELRREHARFWAAVSDTTVE